MNNDKDLERTMKAQEYEYLGKELAAEPGWDTTTKQNLTESSNKQALAK